MQGMSEATRNSGNPRVAQQEDAFFGYERVDPATKTARVRGVFDSVADRYDLMNDLMSLGMHRWWKRLAVEILDLRPRQRVLDLAAGTADISSLIVSRRMPDLQLVSADINGSMLAIGRDKLIDSGNFHATEFVQANAESLPLHENAFDRVIIAFGLRNVTAKQKALEEISRVLKPGGKLVVLEFSKPAPGMMAQIYDTYSFKVLPRIGECVVGDGESYRYLAESIRVHPDQESLSLMMRRAGFDCVRFRNLIRGVVAIHSGRVL